MRATVLCAIFLLIFAVVPASSALIPYTITGSYYDYSTGLTHQVFGSTIIENQPDQDFWYFSRSTGEEFSISLSSGGGYLLKDVLDGPLGSDWGIHGMTHYFAYSFSLTSLSDPSVSFYQDRGWFRFEDWNGYVADKYTTMLHSEEEWPLYDFYYSDLTPYSLYDAWSWHNYLAPVIKVYGGSKALLPSTWTRWDLTLTSAVPVPEPGTLLLLGSGLAGLALYRRRMNKA